MRANLLKWHDNMSRQQKSANTHVTTQVKAMEENHPAKTDVKPSKCQSKWHHPSTFKTQRVSHSRPSVCIQLDMIQNRPVGSKMAAHASSHQKRAILRRMYIRHAVKSNPRASITVPTTLEVSDNDQQAP